MIEQQFLTTFNSITTFYNKSSQWAHHKLKGAGQIVDFINGTYQGNLSQSMDPEGPGIVIDDQFNFVYCSNWEMGKIAGLTFIKLANQITIWGAWAANRPVSTSCVKIGGYTIYIPYNSNSCVYGLKRPKKCIIHNTQKQKLYLAAIERYPEGTLTKREYSIVIQKKISTKQQDIHELAMDIDLLIKDYEISMDKYLDYLQSQKLVRLSQMSKGLFIRASFNSACKGTTHEKNFNNFEAQIQTNLCLGLLLDKKKYHTRSAGVFSSFANENHEIQKVSLNGLGISKTIQSESVIGIFKDDMLIRQLNSEQNIDSFRVNSKNYARNINGSVVKQLLGHQHMRSMHYQHNYVYFPQIKKIVAVAVELHKYVEMFERLSPHEIEPDLNESNHHPTQKYLNDNYINKQQQSSGSIIDSYPEFKLNLKKQIYHQHRSRQKSKEKDRVSRPVQQKQKNHIMIIQDQSQVKKKTGFILTRAQRQKRQRQRQRENQDLHREFDKRKGISPSESPLRLNKKLPHRSPVKVEGRSPKWNNKWNN